MTCIQMNITKDNKLYDFFKLDLIHFISVYVGCATVGAAAWWFMVYHKGPGLNYYQLVRSH